MTLRTGLKIAEILLVFVLGTILCLSYGCNANGNIAANSNQVARKTESMEVRLQKVFPKTGFRICLVVKDSDGLIITPEGSATIECWIQKENRIGTDKDKLIYEWDNLTINSNEFDPTMEGTPVVLDWGDFHLISDDGASNYEADTYCTLQVILNTSDGLLLSSDLKDVNIFMKYTCC